MTLPRNHKPNKTTLPFRPITTQALTAFRQIALRTFQQTFAHENTPDDFNQYVSQAFSPETLSALLTDPTYHAWFAMEGDQPIGYVALRDIPSPYAVIKSKKPIMLERIYVDQAHQSKGFGQSMMAFCLEQAKHLGGDAVWLGVWEHNETAQRFYKKQGFKRVGEHEFWLGNSCQTDWLMMRRVNPL